jgi:hypothetical protein
MLDCSHQSSWGKQLTAGAPNDQIQFAVSISTDRDGFMRYTCPSCGLDFKTQIDPADLQWLLTSYCRRAGLEIGARGSDSSSPYCFWCPYCGDRAESRQMLTEETVTYLKRIVHREYVLPQLSRMFAGLADSFGGQKQSGGLLSLSIELKHSRSVLPVRPMHGPEPGGSEDCHALVLQQEDQNIRVLVRCAFLLLLRHSGSPRLKVNRERCEIG